VKTSREIAEQLMEDYTDLHEDQFKYLIADIEWELQRKQNVIDVLKTAMDQVLDMGMAPTQGMFLNTALMRADELEKNSEQR
jgi:hypothetical protein